MKKILPAILIIAILTGCSSIEEGEVVNKYVEPEHRYVQFMRIQTGSICSGGGTKYSSRTCVPTYTQYPYWVTDDEDFALVLESCSYPTKGKPAECKRGRVDVTPEEYNRVSIGTWWSREERGPWTVKDNLERNRRARQDEIPPTSERATDG